MELTPNKPPLDMTIGQLFAQLAKQGEHWSEQERAEFKKAWVEGAVRMNQETENQNSPQITLLDATSLPRLTS